jgi:hypothetical protein
MRVARVSAGQVSDKTLAYASFSGSTVCTPSTDSRFTARNNKLSKRGTNGDGNNRIAGDHFDSASFGAADRTTARAHCDCGGE